jgi:hypothetical protein
MAFAGHNKGKKWVPGLGYRTPRTPAVQMVQTCDNCDSVAVYFFAPKFRGTKGAKRCEACMGNRPESTSEDEGGDE